MHDHDGALFESSPVLAQCVDERIRRGVRQSAVCAEQHDARRRVAGERDQPAESRSWVNTTYPCRRAHAKISVSDALPSPTALQCRASMPAERNASTHRGDRFMSTSSFNVNRERLPAPPCATRRRSEPAGCRRFPGTDMPPAPRPRRGPRPGAPRSCRPSRAGRGCTAVLP